MVGSLPCEVDRKLAPGVVTDLAALGLLWLMMVCVIDPVGNFPLNDDWSYGRAVQTLVEHRQLQLTGFTAMPLVAQVLWGALFSLPAGFSFTALRLSTLVLGLVGLLVTYGLVREVRASRGLAVLAGLSLAFNPLYCLLSFTFMTDVPFFTFSMLGILFLVRGRMRRRRAELAVGFLFTGVALLIRQPAILIPAAFGISYLLIRGLTRSSVTRAAAPTLVAAGVLVGYRRVLAATIGVPSLYGRPFDPITESAQGLTQGLALIAGRLSVAAVYIGLFLLPFAAVVTALKWQAGPSTGRRSRVVAMVAVVGVIVAVLIRSHRLMPLSGNVLFDVGLGPPTLRDTYLLGLRPLPRAPRGVWILATAAGVLGAGLIVQQLVAIGLSLARRVMHQRAESDFPALLALAACALYLGLIAVVGYLDRYLIFVLPLILVAIATPDVLGRGQPRRVVLGAAGVLLAGYGLFSVTGTHDYLSWNRARWAALRHLTVEEGVPPRAIDGGFEFNGLYAYNPAYQPRPGKSFWWVQDDQYILSFGPIPGYEVAERYPYRTWLPPGTGEILVLRKLDTTNLGGYEVQTRPETGDEARGSTSMCLGTATVACWGASIRMQRSGARRAHHWQAPQCKTLCESRDDASVRSTAEENAGC